MHCKRAGDQYLLFSLKEVFITSCKVGKLCSLSSLGMCKAAVSLDLSVHCHRVQCVSVSTSGEIFHQCSSGSCLFLVCASALGSWSIGGSSVGASVILFGFQTCLLSVGTVLKQHKTQTGEDWPVF